MPFTERPDDGTLITPRFNDGPSQPAQPYQSAPGGNQPLVTPPAGTPDSSGFVAPQIQAPLLTPYFPGQGGEGTPQNPFPGWNGVGLPPGSSVDPPGAGPNGQPPGMDVHGIGALISQILGGGGGAGIMPGAFPGGNLRGTGNAPAGGATDWVSQLLGGLLGGGTAGPQSALTPSYLSDMLPGGVPTSSPAQVAGMPFISAQQISQLPSMVAATMGGAPQMNPALVGAVPQPGAERVGGLPQMDPNTIDPSSVTKQILAGLSPQFAQQNHALDESLANAGIVGGSSAGAHVQQGLQQQNEATAAIAPYIMQAETQNQAAKNRGQEFNIGNTLQQRVADVSSGNEMSRFNAGNVLQALFGNQAAMNRGQEFNIGNLQQNKALDTAALNRAQEFNIGNELQRRTTNQSTDLQGQLENRNTARDTAFYNADSQNKAQQFDINNIIRGAMGDTAAYNQMAQFLAQLQSQDWLSQLGAQANLSTAGAGAQASSFNPIFQPAANVGGGFMQLAGLLAPGGH